MKQFVKTVTIFILPLLFVGIIGEVFLRNIPNDYKYKRNYLDQYSDSIKVLFLGNSHTYYGINPVYMQEKSFNAGYISQSLNYDLGIIKKYDKSWASLKYIVLSVDYFSLFSSIETSSESWRVKNYSIYYGINIRNEIADHLEILSNKFIINLKRIYSYYWVKQPNISSSEYGWGTDYNSKDNKNLDLTGPVAAKRHTVTDDAYFNKNLSVVRSIIEHALFNKIKVILFTSPAYKTYVSNLNRNQMETTISTLKSLEKKYPNTVYRNFLTDTTFVKNDFYDADHLNETGARIFTLKLDSLIKKS